MKKLMIAACAVALATVTQAATVNWGSGYLKAPTSATDGAAGGSYLGSTYGTWTATFKVYADQACTELLAYDTVTMLVEDNGSGGYKRTFTQGENDKKSTGKGTIATTFGTPAGIKVTGAVWDALELNTGYYAKMFIEGDTADYTATKESDAFAFTTKSAPSTAVDVGSANTAKWSNTFLTGSWNVEAKGVPEPTSGLLLLLGMAGLALKRKRA